MTPHWVHDVAFWIVVVGCAPATLFPILYGTRSPWYRSHIGRALLVKGVAVALLFDLSVVAVLWPRQTGSWMPYVALAVYALVVIGVTYQCIVMLWLQHKGRQGDDDERRDM